MDATLRARRRSCRHNPVVGRVECAVDMESTVTCRICDADQPVSFLTRTAVPVHQNLLCHDRQTAMSVPRGDLRLVVCTACGFVFNESFDASKLAYGSDYDNRQDSSPAFRQHVNAL